MNDLFDTVPRARNTDPETSHGAAASVEKVTFKQDAVLWVLKHFGPSTHEQLIERYRFGQSAPLNCFLPNQSDSGLRTRCNELVRAGLVRDSGRRERLKTGRNGIVWEAV